MPELHPSIRHIPRPARIARLPIDHRGYPVPAFVQIINGIPDHRVVNPAMFLPAITEKRCWICGDVLGRNMSFVLGPMCTITRTVSEPPSHRECGIYAMQACPFLSKPHMIRREAGMPEGVVEAAGNMEKRNPGVMCLWITRSYTIFQDHQCGILFKVGDPTETHWYSAGREATRYEVLDALDSGVALLRQMAHEEGNLAELTLDQMVKKAMRHIPGDTVRVP